MRKADHIIDMGPLAAHLGGEVVAEGSATFLSNSWVKFTYQGKVYILPLSLPLSDSEGHKSHLPDLPDNWKNSTIGCWLVTVEELL